MSTPQRLSAILFTAYMLALMWTIRAHGQAPLPQADIAAPAAAPLTLEPIATPQGGPLPAVQLASPEQLTLARPVAAASSTTGHDATQARWLMASGASLLLSAGVHMAAFGRRAECHGARHTRFVAPFISGGIVALTGAILTVAGARRWSRLINPPSASEGQQFGLFFGGAGIALAGQMAMLIALAPEGLRCLGDLND
ncbi:MAG: hypothetical protein JWN04_742 [Myxococcaceae bacterium]|nr:hypothetical protein [Myxococcaceae bacterium]